MVGVHPRTNIGAVSGLVNRHVDFPSAVGSGLLVADRVAYDPCVARWADIHSEVPEFAARVQTAFERNKHMTLATVRRDGSPRISGTELRFDDGDVFVGMMARSRKALDLLRDPRIAIHGPTADPPDEPREWVGESKLAGRAIEVPNDDPDDDSYAFRVDIDEVVFTHINDTGDRLVIESWHPGRALEVVERE